MLDDPLKLEAQAWRNHFNWCVKGGNLGTTLEEVEELAKEEGSAANDVEVLAMFFHGARVHNMELKGFNVTQIWE